MRNHVLILGVVGAGMTALLAVAGPGQAANSSLDMQPGLWEITSAGEMSGVPPIPPEALANMPTEQRAQLEAVMQAERAHITAPHVVRHCVTEEQLRRGLNLDDTPNPSCQRTVLSNSTRLLVMHEECTGKSSRVGDFRFEAVDRQTMKGSIHMVVSNGANTMTINRNLQGKWLGADCGDVKPKD